LQYWNPSTIIQQRGGKVTHKRKRGTHEQMICTKYRKRNKEGRKEGRNQDWTDRQTEQSVA